MIYWKFFQILVDVDEESLTRNPCPLRRARGSRAGRRRGKTDRLRRLMRWQSVLFLSFLFSLSILQCFSRILPLLDRCFVSAADPGDSQFDNPADSLSLLATRAAPCNSNILSCSSTSSSTTTCIKSESSRPDFPEPPNDKDEVDGACTRMPSVSRRIPLLFVRGEHVVLVSLLDFLPEHDEDDKDEYDEYVAPSAAFKSDNGNAVVCPQPQPQIKCEPSFGPTVLRIVQTPLELHALQSSSSSRAVSVSCIKSERVEASAPSAVFSRAQQSASSTAAQSLSLSSRSPTLRLRATPEANCQPPVAIAAPLTCRSVFTRASETSRTSGIGSGASCSSTFQEMQLQTMQPQRRVYPIQTQAQAHDQSQSVNLPVPTPLEESETPTKDDPAVAASATSAPHLEPFFSDSSSASASLNPQTQVKFEFECECEPAAGTAVSASASNAAAAPTPTVLRIVQTPRVHTHRQLEQLQSLSTSSEPFSTISSASASVSAVALMPLAVARPRLQAQHLLTCAASAPASTSTRPRTSAGGLSARVSVVTSTPAPSPSTPSASASALARSLATGAGAATATLTPAAIHSHTHLSATEVNSGRSQSSRQGQPGSAREGYAFAEGGESHEYNEMVDWPAAPSPPSPLSPSPL